MQENLSRLATPPDAGPDFTTTIGLYWNALLAWLALSFHCTPFAAFDFLGDGGAAGRRLFPLAPLALILVLFCSAALLVQFVVLLMALRDRSPVRGHRMIAMALTCSAIGLIFVAGKFGWFIHA